MPLIPALSPHSGERERFRLKAPASIKQAGHAFLTRGALNGLADQRRNRNHADVLGHPHGFGRQDRVGQDQFLELGGGNARQPNNALEAVKRYLAHDARNSAVWIEQGLLQFTIGQNNEGMASLRKAVEVGGEAARNALRNDARFEPLRNQPAFQSLIQAQPTVFNMSNGGLGMP